MNDAELMKTLRSQLGLTQSQMAERCGYGSQTRISDIETGKENLSGPARKLLEELKEKAGNQESSGRPKVCLPGQGD